MWCANLYYSSSWMQLNNTLPQGCQIVLIQKSRAVDQFSCDCEYSRLLLQEWRQRLGRLCWQCWSLVGPFLMSLSIIFNMLGNAHEIQVWASIGLQFCKNNAQVLNNLHAITRFMDLMRKGYYWVSSKRWYRISSTPVGSILLMGMLLALCLETVQCPDHHFCLPT